jgi:hypothetical protein
VTVTTLAEALDDRYRMEGELGQNGLRSTWPGISAMTAQLPRQ